MDLELSGRTAIVTGAHRGTGEGLAHVLAREGARVWVHGFEEEAAERVAASIRDRGGDARAVAGDIRTDSGADVVTRAVGEVDILVNNYGVAEGGDWQSPTEDWVDIYQKNVLSASAWCAPSRRACAREVGAGCSSSARSVMSAPTRSCPITTLRRRP